MRHGKYPSFNEAITDLESKGKLKYWGRIGDMGKIYLYTFICEGIEYTLNIMEDGKVEIRE